ncbi:MAG: HlyD family secretion protein [Phycisphaerae bacterium]|jgi:multidrug resistance efflux pump
MISKHTVSNIFQVGIWLIAVVVSGMLFVNETDRTVLRGIAYSYEQPINAVETGYIRSINVKLYERVTKGQTLAVVKENTIAREEYINANLEAQRATAEAELEQLKAELAAAEVEIAQEQGQLADEKLAMNRRLNVDWEEARFAVLEIKADLAPEKLELKDLQVQIDIVKKLIASDAAEQYELEVAMAAYERTSAQVAAHEQLLAQAEKNLAAAQARLDEAAPYIPLSPKLADARLEPIRKAIIVQEMTIEEILKQRDIIVLTAPFDGYINEMICLEGQTVVRGDPIMTVVKERPEYVVAWLNENQRAKVNQKVEIVSLSNMNQAFESQISDVSPSIAELPERLWLNPKVPEYGQTITIPFQPDFACLHNEMVGIKLKRR